MYLLSYLKYSKYLFYPNYKKVDPKQRLLLAICLGSFYLWMKRFILLFCHHLLIESIHDGVGERDVGHHDVFTLQVFACLEEDLSGRNDDVGTVFFQGEGNLALLDAQGLHHRIETLQFGKRQVLESCLLWRASLFNLLMLPPEPMILMSPYCSAYLVRFSLKSFSVSAVTLPLSILRVPML